MKYLDVWVGILVIVAFLCLFFLALRVGHAGHDRFVGTYQLSATFDDVGQLRVNAPIKSAGVLVGRVTSITMDYNSYNAVVVMMLDKRYKLPVDSAISVLTTGLLGEQYLGIDPGIETNFFAPGATVKRTQSAVVLEKLISQFLFSQAQGHTSHAP